MKQQYTFLGRLANILIVIVLLGYLLVIGKNFLIPIIFAILFSFLLMPISAFFEKLFRNRIIGIAATLLLVTLCFSGIIVLVTFQFVDIVQDLPSLGKKITQGLESLFDLLESYKLSPPSWSDWIQRNISTLIQTPFAIVATSLSASTELLANMALSALYTFFFLLYRRSFKNFVMFQFNVNLRERVNFVMNDIKHLLQNYLRGLGTVIIILSILNSIGLWVIGVKYPMFWGVLAAFLVIIPYIGTTLGGTLPFLYSLATTDNYWQPAAVAIFYIVIQQIEGNIITPRIVGSSVRINPLVSIMALILSGMLWGIAGIILAIPIMAVFKVLMEQIDLLKPVSVLLGTELYDDKGVFEKEYDQSQYRLLSYLLGPKFKKQIKNVDKQD